MSSDSNTRLATHANELFARFGILLFIWIISSIPWLLNIDIVLEYFVSIFNPCSTDCLNLYQPEKWSELRWIISGFLGFITIVPLVNFQFWTFSKPGLTNSERKMVKLTLMISPVLFLIVSYITVIELLPLFYQLGHNVHTEYGFVTKYDAISLIYFATMILWIQVLVIISSSIMISSGLTGNLDSSNANWWRIRVYGFIALVSLLSYYERTSNGVLITIITLAMIEFFSRPWTTKPPRYNFKIEEKFSSQGDIIKTLNISCNCEEGLNSEFNNYLVMKNICHDKNQQDELVKLIITNKPNNLVIHCCTNEEIWHSLQNTAPHVNITLNRHQELAE